MFGDHSCISFFRYRGEKQTNSVENPAPMTAIGMDIKKKQTSTRP